MIRKHVIAGQYSASQQSPTVRRNEILTSIPLANERGTLVQGISAILADLYRLNVFPSEVGLDLLILAELVFAADTRLSRQTESQDSWTRQIRLVVPVSNVPLWVSTTQTITKMLRFLTGDLWEVDFISRPDGQSTLLSERPANVALPTFTKTQLFSGGLDSLIGAIDNLESNEKPLLISHAGDAATSAAQHECFEKLKAAYPNNLPERLRLWMNIDTSAFGEIPTENTTRGRSFLFFSIGVLAGTGFSTMFSLEAPENGLIALNVPLDSLRLGALSTHTTHEFYMKCWNELLMLLNIEGQILNPYRGKTKGEMVDDCRNQTLLAQIVPDSLSCSSPAKGRWQGHGIEHCGYCLPCLIRRASLFEKVVPDTTHYRLDDLYSSPVNTHLADGQQIRSFQLAIHRLAENPSLSKYLIHKSGPLPFDSVNLQLLGDVYLRGMQEVGRLLENVVTEPINE